MGEQVWSLEIGILFVEGKLNANGWFLVRYMQVKLGGVLYPPNVYMYKYATCECIKTARIKRDMSLNRCV